MAIPLYVTDGIWGEISPDGTQIAFSRFSDTDLGADGTGTFQLWIADFDGSATSNETCLTSSIATTHVGMASWHPSGDWLVVSREMTVGYDGLHENAHPGKGIFVNLWAVRPDGTDWTQLTDYATTRDGSPMHSPIGALQARFNGSGDKMAWSRKIGTDVALPFAYWDIAIAEFTLPSDVPTLSSESNVTPGSATFYEVWDWTNDDSKILIATDAYTVPPYLNAALYTVSGGTLELVTGPDREWDEQAFISPDGTRVAITTTRGQTTTYDPIGDWWGTLNNDIWIADAARYGLNAERLTYVNDPTHWMYVPRDDGVVIRATANQWTDDGLLLVNIVSNLDDVQYHSAAELWVISVGDGEKTSSTTEVLFAPSADAFITNLTPTTNYGSNTSLIDGDSSVVASGKYRSLLKFDLSSLSTSTLVQSARLMLYEYSASDTLGIHPWDAELFRLLVDWTGAQVTWNARQTGTNWTTAGAGASGKDADLTAVATLSMDGVAQAGFVEWSATAFTELVQAWVDGTYSNYGVALAAPEAESTGTTATAANLYYSVDYTVPELRPRLVLTYDDDGLLEATQESNLALLAAASYGFKLRFVSVDPDTLAATDISDKVGIVETIWAGEIAPNIYGWSIGIGGDDYDRVLLAPGRIARVYRSFTIDGVDVDGELLWYEGYLRPGSVSANFINQQWRTAIIDPLTYWAQHRSAPIFNLGELNIASGASVTADSETEPQAIADEGEFIGLPSLAADSAVDEDMGSLWVSGKAPAITDVDVWPTPNTDELRASPNEIYNPGFGLDKQSYQWVEFSTPGNYTYSGGIRIMTRYGFVNLWALEYGEPFGREGSLCRWAIVCYDRQRFSELFAEVAHAPVYEWRNAGAGLDFGFNLDGQGDYIALNGGDWPGGESAHDWHTMYVEDGPLMGQADYGTIYSRDGAPNYGWINTTLDDGPYAEDYFAGWFVQANRGAGGLPNWNKQRKIERSDATDGSNHTRLYTTHDWAPGAGDYDYTPQVGHSVRVTPYPYATDSGMGGMNWPINDKVPPPSASNSNRTSLHLYWRGTGSWIEDESPQPGWSGITPDASLWSWIDVQPAEMTFTLSSPLADSETDAYLSSTDGLLPTGNVYIGVQGPFEYTAKTATTIALADPWSGGFVPEGTLVLQEQNGASQPLWPVDRVRVKRRPIPTDNNVAGSTGIRTISNLRVFVSNLLSPRRPGEDDDWREDWVNQTALWGVGPGNEATTITFNTGASSASNFLDENGHLRYRHYLFGIRAMSDESFGRINEIEILPPASVVGGSVTNLTVAGFFKYILETMGFDSADIQYGDGSTDAMGSLSTDSSSYLAVLSDLASRTGQVVWAGPKEWKVRISNNPNWPSGVSSSEPDAYLERDTIRSLELVRYNNQAISQVIVTVRDAEGNVGYGEFPAVPLAEGEPYVERQIFHAAIEKAYEIARAMYWEKIADQLTVTLVGPAPWARAGEKFVRVYGWDTATGVSVTGNYIIKAVEHDVQLGTTGAQSGRSFTSKFHLVRLINS